jgi:hypothetical protein
MPVLHSLERALIEHLDFNMMFRWFVGLSQDEPVWDHSSFSANRDRLFKESVMREFFGGVVAIAEWAELISDEHFSVDGSLLRAWASHKSLAARDGSDEPRAPTKGATRRWISAARNAQTRPTSPAPIRTPSWPPRARAWPT